MAAFLVDSSVLLDVSSAAPTHIPGLRAADIDDLQAAECLAHLRLG